MSQASAGSNPADDAFDRACLEGLAPNSRGGLVDDQAILIYEVGPSTLLATVTAACVLASIVTTPSTQRMMGAWVGAVMIVAMVRAWDVLFLHPARRARRLDGRRELRLFMLGMSASCALWAAFPVMFFASTGLSQRCAASIVLAAMGGGSATVLGAFRPAALVALVAQLLPISIMFLRENELQAHVLGGVELTIMLAAIGQSGIANRSILNTLRLGRANSALAAAADRDRREAEAANVRLTEAQVALNDANHTLEGRIAARTADLEREIAERKRYAEALSLLANTDPLTGLCNRNTFAERLARMLAEAETADQHCAVLFLDLDDFKQINDVRGHEAGDRILQAVARLLSGRAGGAIELARWGGDEFVVALPIEPGSPAALHLGEDLRRLVATPLQTGLDQVRIDVTIGIAIFPQHGRSQDELIRAADVAMYHAKKEGGDRVVLFDQTLASVMAERHRLQQALHAAMEGDQLSLVFQPIVSARNGQCEALEALARWHHPTMGMVEPSVFIPLAEQSGQIQAIGQWALRQACLEAASWPACHVSGCLPAVTVNVSVAQVLSATLIQDVAAALAESGLPPHRLHLEITESMFVSDHVRVTPVFEHLRRQGIRILLDDFGTGFSSLAYLGKLPIDVIKIDQSFVRASERDGFAVIKAVLSIARAMSLEVTAEGVETIMQRTVLASIGVERLQGYLISRPLPSRSVASWLEMHGDPVANPIGKAMRAVA